MKFTSSAYSDMLDLLKEHNYYICDYTNYEDQKKSVILRHDIDFNLECGVELAKIEYAKNIKSTYFVLLSTNFYNIFSKESNDMLKIIMGMGHEIGLHFDEKKYKIENSNDLEYYVSFESQILGKAIGKEIRTISMHRPSKWILENDIKFKNVINTYSKEFFQEFKYLSDSRMHWREDVIKIIKSKQYNKLHILTHPFWYSNKNERIETKLFDFINASKLNTFRNLKNNFRDLEEYIDENTLNGVDFNAR